MNSSEKQKNFGGLFSSLFLIFLLLVVLLPFLPFLLSSLQLPPTSFSSISLNLSLIILGVIVLFIAIFLISGIHVVNEWERLPVLRLGRFVGLRGPGIIYVIPIIERVPIKISLRLGTMSLHTEQTLTADNVPVNVDAVMYYKPVDPEKCILNVEDYIAATQWSAQTTLREVIGKANLNTLLSEREEIGRHLREIIDQKTETWGVKVTSVEVKDVIIPSSLQEAMSRQAQAERERIARVTLAAAEFQAANQFLEAAKLYEANPHALALRWMNILYELGQQSGTNTIMLIPSNMPVAGYAPIGLFGMGSFTSNEEKKKKENNTESK
jgi:regulator of protease activity HflC (stomatin/prohibitin superfamily)